MASAIRGRMRAAKNDRLRNLELLFVAEGYVNLAGEAGEGPREWCIGRKYTMPVTVMGAGCAGIPVESGCLLQLCFKEVGMGEDHLHRFLQTDSGIDVGDPYDGIELRLSFDEFVPVDFGPDARSESTYHLADCDVQCGALKVHVLQEWAAGVVLHWGLPVEWIRLRQLDFHWTTIHDDLITLCIDGPALTINETRDVVAGNTRKGTNEPSDDEPDWSGLASGKAKPKKKAIATAKPKGKGSKQNAEPLHSEVGESDPANNGDAMSPDNQFLRSLAQMLTGTDGVIDNLESAALGAEEIDAGEEHGDDEDAGIVVEENQERTGETQHNAEIAGSAHEDEHVVEVVRLAHDKFKVDPDSVKFELDASNKAWLVDATGNRTLQLATQQWVSPETCKLICSLHGAKCFIMLTGTECWGQVDLEINEYLKLAGAYEDPGHADSKAHHIAAGKAGAKRVWALTKLIKDGRKENAKITKAHAKLARDEKRAAAQLAKLDREIVATRRSAFTPPAHAREVP